MPLSESDTSAKLIDPALHIRGWTEDLLNGEEMAGAVEIVDPWDAKDTIRKCLKGESASGVGPLYKKEMICFALPVWSH